MASLSDIAVKKLPLSNKTYRGNDNRFHKNFKNPQAHPICAAIERERKKMRYVEAAEQAEPEAHAIPASDQRASEEFAPKG